MPLSMSVSSSALPDRLECGTCGRVFSRSEHLRRHELIHSQHRPYHCDQCGKDFFRKDALDRHKITHEPSGPSLLEKGARACLNCATAKVRCSGDLPACARCHARDNLTCKYPTLSSTSLMPDHDAVQNPSEAQDVRETSSLTNITPRASHSGNTQTNFTTQSTLEGFISNEREWDSNIQSTINWLSNDDFMYLDGFGMADMDQGFLFPPVPSTNGNNQLPFDPVFEERHGQTQAVSPAQVREHSNGAYLASDVNASSMSTATPHSSLVSGHEEHVEGEFYVDGQPARLPRVKRRRLTTSTPMTNRSEDARCQLRLDGLNSTFSTFSGLVQLQDKVYSDMVQTFDLIRSVSTAFDSLSRHHTDVTSSYFAHDFVSKGTIEHLVEAYIESFHPLLPFLHSGSFQELDWQLTLAIAMIGALFIEGEEALRFAESLNEYIYRLLSLAEHNEQLLPHSDVAKAQIRLLHLLFSIYTGGSRSRKSTPCLGPSLVGHCTKFWSGQPSADVVDDADTNGSWLRWKLSETQRRTGYAIWLVDFMLAIHFQKRPSLTLDDAQAPLPCSEELWQTRDAQSWKEIHGSSPSSESLGNTLQQLYVEKHLSKNLGEFSRILLIHGLFRRMWETESYLSNPLAQWTPTAQKQLNNTPPPRSEIWLPSTPIFTKWRNSTCDCLDVLHWSANATIGLASGIEHPTVLHLHFARVVILTPYRSIVALAKHLVHNVSNVSDIDASQHTSQIRRWVIQDQYKARLAMIHAGVLFWHVRRYSSNAFYEPASVALATLTLWAFSTFSQRSKNERSKSDQSIDRERNRNDSDPEENFYDIILLDRPTDDELVQQFVREGHKMKANMNGIGDLYAEGASRKVLVEGRRLLRSITVWRSCDDWIKLLDELISMSRHQP